MQVIRKERAVGVVPKGVVVYEQLEELAISAASHLIDMPVPFCAFNGGGDVFVDIGNKSLGLHALMKFLGATSEQVRLDFCVLCVVCMHPGEKIPCRAARAASGRKCIGRQPAPQHTAAPTYNAHCQQQWKQAKQDTHQLATTTVHCVSSG